VWTVIKLDLHEQTCGTVDRVSDINCDVAHGLEEPEPGTKTLIAVFAGPVAEHLLHFGRDAGFDTVLVDPDPSKNVATLIPGGDDADIVVADHHRPELGQVIKEALAGRSRWIGVIGNPRHQGPHIAALKELGVSDEDIARVHRPIGLNIGSRTPAEIAIATLAGLIADRNGRPGGFEWTR
jgi:xanthine/CO dehydrogenase XdhC/CoxF family maturation factor